MNMMMREMARLQAEFQDDLIDDDDINSAQQTWNRFLPRYYCISDVLWEYMTYLLENFIF